MYLPPRPRVGDLLARSCVHDATVIIDVESLSGPHVVLSGFLKGYIGTSFSGMSPAHLRGAKGRKFRFSTFPIRADTPGPWENQNYMFYAAQLHSDLV